MTTAFEARYCKQWKGRSTHNSTARLW